MALPTALSKEVANLDEIMNNMMNSLTDLGSQRNISSPDVSNSLTSSENSPVPKPKPRPRNPHSHTGSVPDLSSSESDAQGCHTKPKPRPAPRARKCSPALNSSSGEHFYLDVENGI